MKGFLLFYFPFVLSGSIHLCVWLSNYLSKYRFVQFPNVKIWTDCLLKELLRWCIRKYVQGKPLVQQPPKEMGIKYSRFVHLRKIANPKKQRCNLSHNVKDSFKTLILKVNSTKNPYAKKVHTFSTKWQTITRNLLNSCLRQTKTSDGRARFTVGKKNLE